MKSHYLKYILLVVVMVVIAASFFLTDSFAAEEGWLGETKAALKKVHEKVGKLSKGRQAKYGNSQRGDSTKGYRLHARDSSDKSYISYWDYSEVEGRKKVYMGESF